MFGILTVSVKTFTIVIRNYKLNFRDFSALPKEYINERCHSVLAFKYMSQKGFIGKFAMAMLYKLNLVTKALYVSQ
jgi:hypothetical protein